MIKLKKDEPEAIIKSCSSCEHAENVPHSDICICKFVGAVRADELCRKYKFDIFKYDPTE